MSRSFFSSHINFSSIFSPMASSSSTFSSLLRAPSALLSDNRSPPSCCSVSRQMLDFFLADWYSQKIPFGLFHCTSKRRNLVVNSTVSFREPTTSGSKANEGIESLKLKLLVFQRIDVFSKDFDNIAEVEIGAPWPFPPLEATLAHKFQLLGTCKIKITFEKTTGGTGDFEITYFEITHAHNS